MGNRVTRSELLLQDSSVPTMAPKPAPSTTTNAVETLWKAYTENTPDRLKFIDSFLLFLMLSGIVQFVYCILVSSFPYNAFLSGYVISPENKESTLIPPIRFGSTIGQFVLAASLRSQVNPDNKDEFKEVSPERQVYLNHISEGQREVDTLKLLGLSQILRWVQLSFTSLCITFWDKNDIEYT